MNRDVRLEVEGSLLERLVQQALSRGAQLAKIERLGPRKMCISSDAASAEILLGLCRKYGLNCREVYRGGRSEAVRRLKERWTLLPGMILCLVLCAGFLSRMWWVDISFTGPSANLGSEPAIRACLEEEGLRPGMAASAIDTGLVQKKLMAGAGEYSFIGVQVQGVRLLVEAAPEVPSPDLYNIEYARDLVAARDGVVVSVNAKSGTASVKPGDTVRAGQTLIRGEEAMARDSETGEEITASVSALGEVIARCWYEGSAEGSLVEKVTARTGNSAVSCRLRLGDFSLPITECAGFASEETEVEILPVVGLFLPLEVERTTHYETAEKEMEIDAGLLRVQLLALARAEALAKLSRDGIEDAASSFWEDAAQEGNALRIRAVYEICTDIATTRDALLEEVY